jgi:hypothetical protein
MLACLPVSVVHGTVGMATVGPLDVCQVVPPVFTGQHPFTILTAIEDRAACCSLPVGVF